MNGFLVDTNVPSELTRPKSDANVEAWLDDADDERLFLSAISLGEIFQGLALMPEGKRRKELDNWVEVTLRYWFAGRILPVNERIAELWGRLSGDSQRRGRTISTADGLIAATAIEYGLTIVTRNVRDFAGLGIEIVNPWNGD